MFKAHISYDCSYLTIEEDRRLEPKVRLVEKIAEDLCRAMLKGTMKYSKDNWTVQEWVEHLKSTVSASDWYALDEEDSEITGLILEGWSTEEIAEELLSEITDACQGTVHVKVPDLRDYIEGIREEVQPQGPDPEPPDPMYVYKCYVEKEGLA
tara:strand:- start:109 stop:567 length:459 start_codon:yes stop_codon:yes gene_type:complete